MFLKISHNQDSESLDHSRVWKAEGERKFGGAKRKAKKI
jgi:hypothetical protein